MSDSEQTSKETQKINIDIDATIQKLSIKDGDILVVQVPKVPTHIISMLQKQLNQQMQDSGINVKVLTMDKDVKLTVLTKEEQENDD